jgi:acetyl-CoA acetyltransferase
VAARKLGAAEPRGLHAREPADGGATCLAARMVSDPLGVRDCCLVTDGAAAMVMTRADRAQRPVPRQPVYVLGAAEATTTT